MDKKKRALAIMRYRQSNDDEETDRSMETGEEACSTVQLAICDSKNPINGKKILWKWLHTHIHTHTNKNSKKRKNFKFFLSNSLQIASAMNWYVTLALRTETTAETTAEGTTVSDLQIQIKTQIRIQKKKTSTHTHTHKYLLQQNVVVE